jgi:glycine cleavage system H protein
MVVLLIVLMFAGFIAADYMFNREKYRLPATVPSESKAPAFAALHFHPAHTWAAAESDEVARVGLDAFAARLLPVPSAVATPKLARWVSQGGRGITLRFGDSSGEREVTLLSPVDGEVVEVNQEALKNPSLLKSDPYGQGWLMKVRSPDMSVSLRNLFESELAAHWIEESMSRLRQFLAPTALAVAQDGGPMVDSLAGTLKDDAWKKLTAEFFRS